MKQTIKISYDKLVEKRDALIALRSKLDMIIISDDIILNSTGNSRDKMCDIFKKVQHTKDSIQLSLEHTITLLESIEQEFSGLESTIVQTFERS